MGFVIFLVWIGLCIGVGVFADSRGRSGVGWGFFSAVLSPILGFIIVLVLEKRPTLAAGESSVSTGTRKCPFCAELIRAEAIKCKHCGSDVESVVAVAQPALKSTTSGVVGPVPMDPDDMACVNCQKHIPKSAYKCAFCGHPYRNA